MKPVLISVCLCLGAGAALAGGSGNHSHDGMMEVGLPGKAGAETRTVEIKLYENDEGQMLFEPREMAFEAGETVRFVVRNEGENDHEFVLDTYAKNAEHKALMEEFPEMEHDDPNAVRLPAGNEGELVWTFANKGTFEFACLIPGHHEAGMSGPVAVN